jgi:integrase
MAIKTCQEHGKRLMHFFRWLSKCDNFDWKKPPDFDELRLGRITKSNLEKSVPVTSRSQQVQTFTVEELALLNRYAVPIERFLLLCGLNCGFKRMECATLRVGEIALHRKHEFAKYIDFDFSETDSFIRRLRTKSEVFGEWILWPLTVRAMEWVLDRRRIQGDVVREIPFSPTALAFLNNSGYAYTKPTKKNNSNNQLTNTWNRLVRRVRQDEPNFPPLSQECLRDTSSNWIREEFGGEIAEVFLSHGSPLGSKSLVECYTNKPFGKVFAALRWLERKLAPVFEATPPDPFPAERKKGGGGLTLKQKATIRRLSDQHLSAAEIATQAGCSRMSVYRYRN